GVQTCALPISARGSPRRGRTGPPGSRPGRWPARRGRRSRTGRERAAAARCRTGRRGRTPARAARRRWRTGGSRTPAGPAAGAGLRDAGLLLVGVVGAVRVGGGRLLGGLLDRDLPVDRLPVRVVADEFVGRAAPVPRVVSVVHRCPFPLTRRDTARAWRCSARLRPAPGTRRGLPWRLSHGSPWRRWRGRAPRRGRPRPRGARRR